MKTGSDSVKDTPSPDKDSEMIEKVAKWIVNSELEAPSLTLLNMAKPLARIGGDLAYFYLGAFIPLLDNYGYDFLDTFEKRENIELLMQEVDRLSKKRDKIKKKKNEPSFFDKIKLKFRPKKSEEE